MRAMPCKPSPLLAVLPGVPGPDLTTVACVSASPAIRQLWFVPSAQLADRAGPMLAAQLAEGDDFPCDELVVAQAGGQGVGIGRGGLRPQGFHLNPKSRRHAG